MSDRAPSSALEGLQAAKQELREDVLRATLPASRMEEESRRITAAVLQLPEFLDADGIGIYLSMKGEPSTDALVAACRDLGKTVCVPASLDGEGGYAMARLDPGAPMTPGRYGVREPAIPVWAGEGAVDLMIVPGVAFDRHGNRLGHGKGYYDRLLNVHRTARAGLAFSAQWVEHVPHGPGDVPMDLVVTAERAWRCRPGRAAKDLPYEQDT